MEGIRMGSFEYNSNPSRVIFGSGTLKKLSEELARQNLVAPLLLTGPRQVEQAQRVKGLFKGKFAGLFTEATMHTPLHIT